MSQAGGQRHGFFVAPVSGFDLSVELRQVGEDGAEGPVRQGRRLAPAHRRPPQRMRQMPARPSARPAMMFFGPPAMAPLRVELTSAVMGDSS
jgi:hypothetical protein